VPAFHLGGVRSVRRFFSFGLFNDNERDERDSRKPQRRDSLVTHKYFPYEHIAFSNASPSTTPDRTRRPGRSSEIDRRIDLRRPNLRPRRTLTSVDTFAHVAMHFARQSTASSLISRELLRNAPIGSVLAKCKTTRDDG